MRVGAAYLGEQWWEFTVWAPLRQQVEVDIVAPEAKTVAMQPIDYGYWRTTVSDLSAEARYCYRLDGKESYPDPASHFQPEGVHAPSQVVHHAAFNWTDGDWSGIPLDDLIIYELHVGTFTPAGTFAAIAPRLAALKELGVNAIELMPVAQFPGDRNWGYDGTFPYAVQNSYGGPAALKQLVDTCHQQGMAVILDVVYNHFGPEGNYTSQFGPYFTGRYNTPWGKAVNFDDAYSEGARNYVIENALHWFEHYHFDALRLDAIHAIYDSGAYHILAEMRDRVDQFNQQVNRHHLLIAESDLNDVRVIRSRDRGGHGMDAQWSDDYHHCVHTLLTGEQAGYYQDFGQCEQLAKVWRQSFAYTWNYSQDRKRFHGSDPSDQPLNQFVVCVQNHDQVGNRMLGERLAELVSFEALKLAAGTLMLAPGIPMLFMGEEYGEEAPFLYFISHTDPDLVQAVRDGRKREFEAFHLQGEPPDAASVETFRRSTLNWEQRTDGHHGVMLQLYRQLIQLRRTLPPLTNRDRACLDVTCREADRLLTMRRWQGEKETLSLFNFNSQAVALKDLPIAGTWHQQFDSAEAQWMGSGSTLPEQLMAAMDQPPTMPALSVALYVKG
jgi:maltooligosyltrehalose trehalohydrolase